MDRCMRAVLPRHRHEKPRAGERRGVRVLPGDGSGAYSPSALATNGGLTSTPVCSGAV